MDKDIELTKEEELEKQAFFEEVWKKIEEGEEDVRNNRMREASVFFKELREKYGY